MRSAKQFLFGSLGAALALSGLTALTATPAQAASSGIIINEVYGGGGSTSASAAYKADFVELLNPTAVPQSLNGLSLQYRSGTYATGTPAVLALPNVSVPAGSKYLVQVSSNLCSGNPCGGADVPSPDFSGTTLNMAAGSGQVTLAQGTAGITLTGTSMHTVANVIDFVGYGTATSSETAPTGTAATNATSVQRKNTTDADNNQTDFNAPATPSPQGMGAVVQPLNATDPGDKTFIKDQAIAPITLQASGGVSPYTWAVTGGTLPAGLSLADGKITGTPTALTASPVEITVTATDSATPTAATAAATFTISVEDAPTITPIATLQGTGARSPFAPETGNANGTDTKTTEGVVTAAYPVGGFNGLYIQTPGADTPDASDGIFVYGGSTNANIPAGIQVGDSVRVTGKIAEFFNLTQIVPGAGGVVKLGSSLGTITPRAVAFPTTDAQRELLEGELIAPAGSYTISNVYQTNQYGEIGLAAGDGPLKQPTEFASDDDAAALAAIKAENAQRAVVLDDGSTTNYLQNQTTKAQPVPWLTAANGNAVASPPRVNAKVTFNAPVVLDWRNDAWKLQPQGQVTTNGASVASFEDTRAQNLQPRPVGGDVKIATFNVLNYFNTTGEAYAAAGPLQDPPVDTHCTYYTDRQGNRISNNSCGTRGPGIASPNDGRGPRGAATAASLARQETKLARTIVNMGADVIGLEEVENSIKLPGETNRDDALARIVELLNDLEGPGTWKYVRSPGEATTAAAIAEQDTIRPAFIYKPAAVTPVGQSDILFGTDQFANAREPLAQAFKKAGAPDSDAFAVIVNHFKSKGDNSSPNPPATGDNANSDDTGAFNGDRTRQANRLVEFADDFAAERGISAVFLAGDFNAYSEEDPVHALEAGGFELIESDTPGDYSYSHSGLSGSLDHVFGNAAAVALVTGADVWEINANEPISYEYSRYNYNITDLWEPTKPFATSDHNPEIVGLDLPDNTAPAYDEVQVLGTNDFHGRLLPDGGNAAGAGPFATAVDELRQENPNTVFVAAGDLVGASTFESFIQNDNPTIDALNAMHLEVSAAGNHEFDKGYEDFVGRIQDRADWEYIAANVEEPAGRDDLAETWTKVIDGKKIGFVGAVTEDLPNLVNPAGIEGVSVTDVVDATNAAAAALKADGADLVILLVHEGSPTTSCASPQFTDEATTWGNIVQNTSADVDAIISGHTHLAYNCKYTVDAWASQDRAVTQRPVVSAGQYGTNLNKLVFKFDQTTGDLAVVTQDVIGVAGVGYSSDPTVQGIVDDAVAYANTAGAEVLGKMTGPFQRASYNPSGNATENRGGESTLGNEVAEVQRWATDRAGVDTDIAFMNPGGLRADMPGTANGSLRDLTYRQAANVQPFANTLVNMKLTGAQIETVLEQQWQRNAQGGVPSRPFLRLGVSKGFTYTYVEEPETVSAPNSAPVQTFRGEVTGMWLDGVPIDAAQTYSVTVNSFLGGGGDNFWELAHGTDKVDTGQIDLQAMVDYMAQYDADNPLAVDYSQRGVELTLPADAPASYQAGDTVKFDIASWAMSGAGDTKDTELQVKLGDQVLGSFPVDNTVGDQPYDNYGTAAVSVTLPDGLSDGTTELTVYGPSTKTSVPLVIATQDGLKDIQILGTNDFHGRLLVDGATSTQDCDDVLCPAAVLSGTVKQMRQQNPNTVFVAAGDLIGASTFESFIQKDEPTIDALNEAGLEVSAAGNHEFDQGYEDLVGRVQDRADWEYIAANVEEPAGRDDLAETWTKDFDGVTVGFVGAVTEELPSLVSPGGIQGITVTDIVDATNAAAAQLKAGGADLVILLVHEGSASTSCTSPQFTDASTTWGNITQNVSADVDAIVSGHTHLAYDCSFPVAQWASEGRAVTERPVVSAGQYGTNLNKLVFTVDEATGDVVAKSQSIVPLNASSPSDPVVANIVNQAKAQAETLGAVKIGELAAPFNRAKLSNGTTENRGGESTLGNQVAEVQRWATEKPESGSAQIAFMNPGGLRADMVGTLNGSVRDLTYKQAAVVQPFANTLKNMDLTGAQIETVLEQQWQRDASGSVPTRPFLRLGVSEGFTYTYVEKPVTVKGAATFEGEVTGMWLDGEPIDPAQTYSVTVNSFLATGGDNFREFANGAGIADTGKVDLQAMVDYLDAFASSEPLAVDYGQRAVEVEFPADAPATYSAGDHVTFAVGSWAMTGTDAKDASLQVKLGDDVLGTFPVDNTIGTAVYDQNGTASVDVTLPAGLPTGDIELTLVGPTTGTRVVVPLTVKGTVANTALPTITGTAKVGELLTGTAGTWSPTPTSVTYQWLADGAEIAGATSSTFTPGAAQLGAVITLRVTATASGWNDGTATSAATAPVVKGSFTNTALPTIGGTPEVGQELTATSGTWDPAPSSVTYQWRADGTAISGATGERYTLTTAEVGKAITVTVTAHAAGFDDLDATSAATAAVAKGTFASVAAPVISGTPTVGRQLSSTTGTWDPTPTSVTYQWLADGTAISGATGATYTLTAAEAGKAITVTATAHAAGFDDKDATSAATAAVAKATPVVTVGNLTSTYGKPLNVPVTVSAGGVSTAGGTVTLTAGSTVLGTATVGSTGKATVVVAARVLKPADSPITVKATYSGNAGVLTGSDTATVTVKKGAVTITKAVTSPIKVKVTRTAVTVKVTNADGVTVTGTVTVAATGVGSVKGTLVDGKVTVRLPVFSTVGTKDLSIVYNGSSALAATKLASTLTVVR